MHTTPARPRTRIRAIVVAALVLAFVIPWTYAHIAYAWDWKRFQTGTLISCDDQYLVGGYPNKPPELLGHLSDGAPVDFIAGGEINMGVETGDFGLAAQRGNEIDNFAHSPQLHLGESTTIEGVGTFPLKETHSGIVWFTPNPGKALFCFTPDPSFTVREDP